MSKLNLVPISIDRNGGSHPTELEGTYSSLFKDMDRFFDTVTRSFFDDFPSRSNGNSHAHFMPCMDIAETDDEYRLAAEFPGMDEKDINVSLSNGILTLKGEKKSEMEEKKMDFHRVERSFGAFHRSLQVPAEIDPEKIKASFKNGVLNLTLPKTVQARESVRKIPITT